MAEKEILITIRNEIVDDSNVSSGPSVPMATSQEGTATSKSSNLGNVGKIVATNAVKQAASFAVSNYGNLTGDYQTQANIQSGIELLGLGMMVATGPVGMAAAFGSLALKAANQQIELTKKRQETELLKLRTGMINYNGGR